MNPSVTYRERYQTTQKELKQQSEILRRINTLTSNIETPNSSVGCSIDQTHSRRIALYNLLGIQFDEHIGEGAIEKAVNDKIDNLKNSIKQLQSKIETQKSNFYYPIHTIDTWQDKGLEKLMERNNLEFIPNQFIERKQDAIKRNNPFDLVQSAIGREDRYMKISNSFLNSAVPESISNKKAYIDRIKQNKIKYIRPDLEKIPVALLKKILKVKIPNNVNTKLQYLNPNNRPVEQIKGDIGYLMDFLSQTNPLRLEDGTSTRRVQISKHPDHTGKIIVYRKTKTANPEGGKKLPLLKTSINIYDDIFDFLRAQEYIVGGAGIEYDLLGEIIQQIDEMTNAVEFENILPNIEKLEKIQAKLVKKTNHHIVTFLGRYIEKLKTNSHRSQSEMILRGAINRLEKRNDSLTGISNTVSTQATDIENSTNNARRNWDNIGSKISNDLRKTRTQQRLQDLQANAIIRKQSEERIKTGLLDKLTKNGGKRRTNVRPYELFENQFIQAAREKGVHAINIAFSLQKTFLAILKVQDTFKKTGVLDNENLQESIMKHKTLITKSYGPTFISQTFGPLQKIVNQIQMIKEDNTITIGDQLDQKFDNLYQHLDQSFEELMSIDHEALEAGYGLYL